jgi:hypothetical protein
MTRLPDDDGMKRVLIAGGFEGGDATYGYQDGTVELLASDSSWVYREDGEFFDAPMPRARGGHKAVALPDGSVMVMGGTANFTEPYYAPFVLGGTDPVPCIDIYHPTDDRWTSTEDCEDVEFQTSYAAVASDPAYGAVIVGGLDAPGSPQPYVTAFIGKPIDPFVE